MREGCLWRLKFLCWLEVVLHGFHPITHAGNSHPMQLSMNEKYRHLIFNETRFDELPENIRRQGPWQHVKSGEFEKLRPEYQPLTAAGYVIMLHHHRTVGRRGFG
jgi:hypothetical protein